MGSGCFLSLPCPAPLPAGASPAPAVCFLHGLLTELHKLPGAPLSSAVLPEPPSSARGWRVLCALPLGVPCRSPGLALPLGCCFPLPGCPAGVQEPDPPRLQHRSPEHRVSLCL